MVCLCQPPIRYISCLICNSGHPHGQISQMVLPPHHHCEVYRSTHDVTAIGCPVHTKCCPMHSASQSPSCYICHSPTLGYHGVNALSYYTCPTPLPCPSQIQFVAQVLVQDDPQLSTVRYQCQLSVTLNLVPNFPSLSKAEL